MKNSSERALFGASLAVLALALLRADFSAQSLVFDDVAMETGTLNNSFGRGSAMVDIDSDGLLDIVCANALQPNRFYRQKSDGTFEDAAALWGVGTVIEYHWGTLAADFDNDGDDDLYFPNGGSSSKNLPGRPFPNQLLRNDILSSGLLTDVSGQSNDAMDPDPNFGATALDYDRDGFLDIFCSDVLLRCTLLHNTGNLSFDDVSLQAGITAVSDWRHCGSADFDNDGWPDVGVGSKNGANVLYDNQQDGTFVDRAAQAGLSDPFDNFGFVFQDYDNDGFQDVYVPKYQLVPMGPSPVYLNDGDGRFRNVSPGTGMGAHTDMGHESGDLDGDGYPEIMMGTGTPLALFLDFLYSVAPDGNGGLTITNISGPSHFDSGGPTRQHGQALGDYDRDGDIDVYCNNGGPSEDPTTSQADFFWRNRGNSNAWTALEIEGVLSNRTGVGTLAKATTSSDRNVYRTLQVGRGFCNTPDHALHFGIGSDTSVDTIVLDWPSGIVQTIDAPTMSTYTKVVETGAVLRGIPTVGQFLSYDIAGPAADIVELALSMGTATTDVDGVNGPLLLASPFVILPALPLDASGKLTLSLPVPNNPGLVGLTFYSQAWIHSGADLGTLSQLHTFTLQ